MYSRRVLGLFFASVCLLAVPQARGQSVTECCQNDLCPISCVRCDGTPQCFDLSDELGCGAENDRRLLAHEKPPVFTEPVLVVIKEQLRRQKTLNAHLYPQKVCFPPQPTTTTEKPIWEQLMERLLREQEMEARKPTTTTPTTTTTPIPPSSTENALLMEVMTILRSAIITKSTSVASSTQKPPSTTENALWAEVLKILRSSPTTKSPTTTSTTPKPSITTDNTLLKEVMRLLRVSTTTKSPTTTSSPDTPLWKIIANMIGPNVRPTTAPVNDFLWTPTTQLSWFGQGMQGLFPMQTTTIRPFQSNNEARGTDNLSILYNLLIALTTQKPAPPTTSTTPQASYITPALTINNNNTTTTSSTPTVGVNDTALDLSKPAVSVTASTVAISSPQTITVSPNDVSKTQATPAESQPADAVSTLKTYLTTPLAMKTASAYTKSTPTSTPTTTVNFDVMLNALFDRLLQNKRSESSSGIVVLQSKNASMNVNRMDKKDSLNSKITNFAGDISNADNDVSTTIPPTSFGMVSNIPTTRQGENSTEQNIDTRFVNSTLADQIDKNIILLQDGEIPNTRLSNMNNTSSNMRNVTSNKNITDINNDQTFDKRESLNETSVFVSRKNAVTKELVTVKTLTQRIVSPPTDDGTFDNAMTQTTPIPESETLNASKTVSAYLVNDTNVNGNAPNSPNNVNLVKINRTTMLQILRGLIAPTIKEKKATTEQQSTYKIDTNMPVQTNTGNVASTNSLIMTANKVQNVPAGRLATMTTARPSPPPTQSPILQLNQYVTQFPWTGQTSMAGLLGNFWEQTAPSTVSHWLFGGPTTLSYNWNNLFGTTAPSVNSLMNDLFGNPFQNTQTDVIPNGRLFGAPATFIPVINRQDTTSLLTQRSPTVKVESAPAATIRIPVYTPKPNVIQTTPMMQEFSENILPATAKGSLSTAYPQRENILPVIATALTTNNTAFLPLNSLSTNNTAFVPEIEKNNPSIANDTLSTYNTAFIAMGDTAIPLMNTLTTNNTPFRSTDILSTNKTTFLPMNTLTANNTEILPMNTVATKNTEVLPMKRLTTNNTEVLPMSILTTNNTEILPMNTVATKNTEVLPMNRLTINNTEVLPMNTRTTNNTEFLPMNIVATHNTEVLPMNTLTTNNTETLHMNTLTTNNTEVFPVNTFTKNNTDTLIMDTLTTNNKAFLPIDELSSNDTAFLPMNTLTANSTAFLSMNTLTTNNTAFLPERENMTVNEKPKQVYVTLPSDEKLFHLATEVFVEDYGKQSTTKESYINENMTKDTPPNSYMMPTSTESSPDFTTAPSALLQAATGNIVSTYSNNVESTTPVPVVEQIQEQQTVNKTSVNVTIAETEQPNKMFVTKPTGANPVDLATGVFIAEGKSFDWSVTVTSPTTTETVSDFFREPSLALQPAKENIVTSNINNGETATDVPVFVQSSDMNRNKTLTSNTASSSTSGTPAMSFVVPLFAAVPTRMAHSEQDRGIMHNAAVMSWWNMVHPPTTVAPTTTTTSPRVVNAERSHCVVLIDDIGFCLTRAGHYKNPSDCRTYLVCDWDTLFRCSCPTGTMFDAKLKVCNWDYAVTC